LTSVSLLESESGFEFVIQHADSEKDNLIIDSLCFYRTHTNEEEKNRALTVFGYEDGRFYHVRSFSDNFEPQFSVQPCGSVLG
jgi:hypothetical protein